MKATKCALADCVAEDSGDCHQGLNLSDCPHWGAGTVAKTARVAREGNSIPWSGLTLGLNDLALIAARNKPKVVGVLGPHNAGKTTILAMFYLFLKHGKRFGPASFAGSYSFAGWDNIASHMLWKSDEIPPSFPPHTEQSESRVPGLLHVALREEDGKLSDWLFTDAPGEWFRRWSLQESAPDTRGATWVSGHSDVFMLVVDCEALASEEKGRVRGDYKNLIDRLAKNQTGRPVALVWAKYDKWKEDSAAPAVKDHFEKKILNWEEFKLSVMKDGAKPTTEEFERLLAWLHAPPARDVSPPIAASYQENDFFLSYRG